MTIEKICPRCNKNKLHAERVMNALSRIDNKTEICDICGAEEALIDILTENIAPKERK